MDKVKQMRKLTKMVAKQQADVRQVMDNRGHLVFVVVPTAQPRQQPPARKEQEPL